MKLTEKKVLVVGAGISGIAAVELLVQAGVEPILYEANEKAEKEEIQKKLPVDCKVEIIIGTLPEEKKEEISLVVISPGVPIDSPLVEEMKGKGAKIWGEIELAYFYAKGKIAAITGTNGKTTTTTLVGEIVKNQFESAFVVGNIGNAYTKEALHTVEESVTVAEISSFQLESTENFHPNVSAILNITPDHLNRHYTMECYADTKGKVAENQTENDVCVLNYDDSWTRAFGEKVKAKVLYFSRLHILEKGVFLRGDSFIYKDENQEVEVCKIQELKLLGTHNYENVMAAIGIAVGIGVDFKSIRDTILEFRAVEHRIEYVDVKHGVTYYNDSKGTNTDAAIKAVEAMIAPTLVIGGGYDKHVEFDDWILSFKDKVKCLVLLGATANQIAETAKKHGFTAVFFADSLKEAVEICAKEAAEGDAVLLSPACASWGMFDNYEQRGNMFKEYVRGL